MDVPPIAPPSTDNPTVILWVVAILVVVIGLVAKVLWAKIQDNAAEAKLREEKANAKAEAAQAELLKVHGGVILEQTKTQAATNSAMGRMADVSERMVDVSERMLNFIEKTPKSKG